jgi:5-methylthioribose kinase
MGRKDLDAALARRILDGVGRIDPNQRFEAKPMGGGVSSNVLLVENGPWRHVLKQPLRRFRVREEWNVDTNRVRVELEAARLFESSLGASAIMPVLHLDEANEVLVLEAAPTSWQAWRARLLDGEVREAIGHAASGLLARIHALAKGLKPLEFRNDELFRQQRLEPYFETPARKRPELATALESIAKEAVQGDGLIHGDFSPKNILTNGFEVRVIDHEVVTRGDEAFDVAFLINHLLLKSIHLPRLSDELHACAHAVWRTYAQITRESSDFERRMTRFLGALMLGRALGKSRVDYLTGKEQSVATAAACMMLESGTKTLEDAVDVVARAGLETGGNP